MKFASRLPWFLLPACLCLAGEAQNGVRFAAYAQCRFADDLALVENTPLAKGIEGRTVKTVMGPRQVPLAGGVRLMYGYPGTEPLANVKVEQIPPADYAQAKQDLVANFNQILNADDSSARNYALKPRLNGLEIYGLDRKKLEGGVLGIYLFFADRSHVATTVYFLNQDPALRRFASLEEYGTLRDAFLERYTGCVSGRAHVGGEEKAASRSAAPGAEPPPPVTPSAAVSTTGLPEAPLPQGEAAPRDAAKSPGETTPQAAENRAANKPAVVKAKSPAKKAAGKAVRGTAGKAARTKAPAKAAGAKAKRKKR